MYMKIHMYMTHPILQLLFAQVGTQTRHFCLRRTERSTHTLKFLLLTRRTPTSS